MKSTDNSRIELNFFPRPAQKKIFQLMALCQFLTAVCHRRLGKTLGALALIIQRAFLHQDASLPFRGYFISKTLKQGKRNAWAPAKQILGNAKRAGHVNFHETELRIDFPLGGQIFIVGAEKESIEDLRGIYAHFIVMDELASWRDAYYAFNEVIRPALMGCGGKGLFIGTVKGFDILFDFFMRGLSDEFPEWGSIMFKASETGIIPQKELEDYHKENKNNPALVAREMECNFFAEVEDRLISAGMVQPAMGRAIDRDKYRNYPMRMGIDAGITGDPTTICLRQGPKVHTFEDFNIPDHEVLADKMIEVIKYWGVTAVYVDTGRGEQLIIQLRKKLGSRAHILRAVQYNAASPTPACFNFRAFMYYMAKQYFSLPGISVPDDKRFLTEITNQILDMGDNTGTVIRLLSKKKISQMINGSPNKADALVQTFAEGVDASEAQISDRDKSRQDAREILLREGQERSYSMYNHLKNKYRKVFD